MAEAQRLLQLDDLRADRGELDLIDETTGELLRTVPAPIAVVSDNGPCFRRDLRRRPLFQIYGPTNDPSTTWVLPKDQVRRSLTPV